MGLLFALAAGAGCASGPLAGNPMFAAPGTFHSDVENPLFLAPGQTADGYNVVFDQVYDILDEYFDIAYANRFDGTIRTEPLLSAGYADIWRLNLYDHAENLEATFQTVRRFAAVRIFPADLGGYYVDVRVYKELEDLPQPLYSGTGAAIFRSEAPIERQFEVVAAPVLSFGWIPLGRDHSFEQVILSRLKDCL